MLIWRAGDDLFVIERWSCARVPSTGAATWYEGRSFSDEDDLWLTAPVVENGRLVMRTTIEHADDPARITEEKVIAEGLTIERDPAARAVVARAIADREAAERDEKASRARAVQARVDAIAGARDDLGLGPDLALAQATLRDFVAQGSDADARALLDTMFVLAKARPNAAVVNAFARACLRACYSYAKVAPLPAEQSATPDPVLAARLVAHAVVFEKDSEYATYSDSHGREARSWAVAMALREAAVMLGHPT